MNNSGVAEAHEALRLQRTQLLAKQLKLRGRARRRESAVSSWSRWSSGRRHHHRLFFACRRRRRAWLLLQLLVLSDLRRCRWGGFVETDFDHDAARVDGEAVDLLKALLALEFELLSAQPKLFCALSLDSLLLQQLPLQQLLKTALLQTLLLEELSLKLRGRSPQRRSASFGPVGREDERGALLKLSLEIIRSSTSRFLLFRAGCCANRTFRPLCHLLDGDSRVLSTCAAAEAADATREARTRLVFSCRTRASSAVPRGSPLRSSNRRSALRTPPISTAEKGGLRLLLVVEGQQRSIARGLDSAPRSAAAAVAVAFPFGVSPFST